VLGIKSKKVRRPGDDGYHWASSSQDGTGPLEKNFTLIALWGGDGDGRGGTRDMMKQFKKLGQRDLSVDTTKEFALQSAI
jgi:hypothetical protein